jgi:hypothetical protein
VPFDVTLVVTFARAGLKISDFCANHSQKLEHIDIIHFIIFGLVHGFLR